MRQWTNPCSLWREYGREFLECKQNELSPQKQLQLCLEIACGLCFLHTYTSPIVHRGLTDKNVMLGKDGLMKTVDVGQSRLKANNAEYFSTAQPGAIPFMRPACSQQKKMDTSLGVLMLEVATQRLLVQLAGGHQYSQRNRSAQKEPVHIGRRPLSEAADPLQFGGLPLVGNSCHRLYPN